MPRQEDVKKAAAMPGKPAVETVAMQSGRSDSPVNSHANGANGHANSTNGTNGTNVATNGAASQGRTNGKNGQSQPNKRRKRGSGGTRGAPDALKKVMWAGLVSGSMAVTGLAARRASAEIWRGILREDPPTTDV
jgi:hypothetical protein